MDEYQQQLHAIVSSYEGIIALWEDKQRTATDSSERIFSAVYDSELVSDASSLRSQLISQMIGIDAKTETLSDIILYEPMFAPSTKDMQDADFLIRRYGYETPANAISAKTEYNPLIDEMMNRESSIASIVEAFPEKLERVAMLSCERCAGVIEGFEPIRSAHDQWDEMLRHYSFEQMTHFLRSALPRHRDICLSSPFLALFDELFAMWIDEDGMPRRDVIEANTGTYHQGGR